MTRHERIGANLQYGSITAEEAARRMEKSCKICVETGKRIRCKMCAIREAHEDMMKLVLR